MLRRFVRALPPVREQERSIREWRDEARRWKARAREAERMARADVSSIDSSVDEVSAHETDAPTISHNLEPAQTSASEPRQPFPRVRFRHWKPESDLVFPGQPAAPEPPKDSRALQVGYLSEVQQQELKDYAFGQASGVPSHDPRGYPSFERNLFASRRFTMELRHHSRRTHPRHYIPRKLNNYALAQSLGIAVPTNLALWKKRTRVNLSDLPHEFVLKGNGGVSHRSVLPVRRINDKGNRLEVLDGSGTELTEAQAVERITQDEKVMGPWFADTLIVSDIEEVTLPYAFYVFYGEVGFGFARQSRIRSRSSNKTKTTHRFLDAGGQDIEMLPGTPSDQDIPVSPWWAEMVRTAQKLSAALPLPFVRVDLFATRDGVVMGELTVTPGGDQRYLPAQDARLGMLWEEAQARLEWDLITGARPFAIRTGDHPVSEVLQPYLPTRDGSR